MIDTGYCIKNRSIYGPAGYTGYRINNRREIVGPQGYTRHWIHRDHIYSAFEGNTGFCIEKDKIYGPSNQLPWEEAMRRRLQRKKSEATRRTSTRRASP